MKRTILTMLIASSILSVASQAQAGDLRLVDTSSRISWKTKAAFALGAAALVGAYFVKQKALDFGSKVYNWACFKWNKSKTETFERPEAIKHNALKVRKKPQTASKKLSHWNADDYPTGSHLWYDQDNVRNQLKDALRADSFGIIRDVNPDKEGKISHNPLTYDYNNLNYVSNVLNAIRSEKAVLLKELDIYESVTDIHNEEHLKKACGQGQFSFDATDKAKMLELETTKSYEVAPGKMTAFYAYFERILVPTETNAVEARESWFNSFAKGVTAKLPTLYNDIDTSWAYMQIHYYVSRLAALEKIVADDLALLPRGNAANQRPNQQQQAPAPGNAFVAERLVQSGVAVPALPVAPRA